MFNANQLPSLDFEAGMTGSCTQENVTGAACVAAGIVIGVVVGILTVDSFAE
jgi:hypothetical protein